MNKLSRVEKYKHDTTYTMNNDIYFIDYYVYDDHLNNITFCVTYGDITKEKNKFIFNIKQKHFYSTQDINYIYYNFENTHGYNHLDTVSGYNKNDILNQLKIKYKEIPMTIESLEQLKSFNYLLSYERKLAINLKSVINNFNVGLPGVLIFDESEKQERQDSIENIKKLYNCHIDTEYDTITKKHIVSFIKINRN